MNGLKFNILLLFMLLWYLNGIGQENGMEQPFIRSNNQENWYTVIDDKGTEKDLFSINKGKIHVYKKQEANSTQSFGGLITKKSYSHYNLHLEYKWGKKKFKPRQEFVRDAGVIFHMHGEDSIWPNGVECQIQEGDTGDIWAIGTQVTSKVQSTIRNYAPNGDLVTRGSGKRFHRFHRGYFWEVPGWNTIDIEVRGDYAKYMVNGKVVNEVLDMKYWEASSQSWQPLTEGKILLQAEGAEIYYRNVEIRPIQTLRNDE